MTQSQQHPWSSHRAPDEVPTPVAIALADFCRRAGAPASPLEVRTALSLLPAEDDGRVKALADGEAVEGLGPFAAVDVLRGTSAALARQRQACGYYALVETLTTRAIQHLGSSALEAPTTSTPPLLATPEPRSQPFSVRRRSDRPAPRGRFVQVPSERPSLGMLQSPAGRSELETRMSQHPHRFSLLRALSRDYLGAGGAPPTLEEVDALLRAHALQESFVMRERQAVLDTYTEHRGAARRVAWALALRPAELRTLTHELGLDREVEDLRERFRRNALEPRSISSLLDLLGRGRYLEDLGITEKLADIAREELRAALAASGSQPLFLEKLAEREGVPLARLQRALETLGIEPGRNTAAH